MQKGHFGVTNEIIFTVYFGGLPSADRTVASMQL